LEGRILRLLPDGKTWRNDNGDPGCAFLRVGDNLSDTDATVWIANCRCIRFLDCPVAKALARAANLGCDTATVVRRRRSPKVKPRRARSF